MLPAPPAGSHVSRKDGEDGDADHDHHCNDYDEDPDFPQQLREWKSSAERRAVVSREKRSFYSALRRVLDAMEVSPAEEEEEVGEEKGAEAAAEAAGQQMKAEVLHTQRHRGGAGGGGAAGGDIGGVGGGGGGGGGAASSSVRGVGGVAGAGGGAAAGGTSGSGSHSAVAEKPKHTRAVVGLGRFRFGAVEHVPMPTRSRESAALGRVSYYSTHSHAVDGELVEDFQHEEGGGGGHYEGGGGGGGGGGGASASRTVDAAARNPMGKEARQLKELERQATERMRQLSKVKGKARRFG
jgi:hypothetical protein